MAFHVGGLGMSETTFGVERLALTFATSNIDLHRQTTNMNRKPATRHPVVQMCAWSCRMRRFVGLVPVLLLAISTAVSAVIGLSLSDGASTPSVADRLGCHEGRSSHPQAGVEQETCSYHGDTIVILTLSKGRHVLYPPLLPDNFIVGPLGDVNAWVVGCQRRDDCVAIKRQLGGDVTSGWVLALSLLVG
jgi:hypothetical protein